MSATYNGWTNYETWSVNLWLENEEGIYRYWREAARACWVAAKADETFSRAERARFALADQLKDAIEVDNPLVEPADLYADLLGAALSEVHWGEIAQGFLTDIAEEQETRS